MNRNGVSRSVQMNIVGIQILCRTDDREIRRGGRRGKEDDDGRIGKGYGGPQKACENAEDAI